MEGARYQQIQVSVHHGSLVKIKSGKSSCEDCPHFFNYFQVKTNQISHTVELCLFEQINFKVIILISVRLHNLKRLSISLTKYM